jgi:hypothetical protein
MKWLDDWKQQRDTYKYAKAAFKRTRAANRRAGLPWYAPPQLTTAQRIAAREEFIAQHANDQPVEAAACVLHVDCPDYETKRLWERIIKVLPRYHQTSPGPYAWESDAGRDPHVAEALEKIGQLLRREA